MTGSELLLSAWDRDPIVLASSAAAAASYGAARKFQFPKRAWFFVAALLTFTLAMLSPIGVLSRGYLFSAHMLQHLLLVLVVPPLALLSLDLQPETKSWASFLARRPIVAWGLGVGAMWLWHAPTLCNAASQSLWVQRGQTISLLLMGTAFWWPLLAPRAGDRLQPFAGMIYLFTACTACTALGILVTFSPVEVCSVFAHPVDRLGVLPLLQDSWGLTPKNDQEIGGLLMWVPACLGYAGGIVAMLARYYRQEEA